METLVHLGTIKDIHSIASCISRPSANCASASLPERKDRHETRQPFEHNPNATSELSLVRITEWRVSKDNNCLAACTFCVSFSVLALGSSLIHKLGFCRPQDKIHPVVERRRGGEQLQGRLPHYLQHSTYATSKSRSGLLQ